ncbi:hypothetical protein AVEN_200554-1 [Araneus ventricosus]|uniref:Uncharacterized protein n=1 Tax=Araneus ventricosus TaxID=182803 RepID=A0A4Y2IXK3_ARAVE|nr:hypothetical protein AVEN_200554-1 [Araneus ventricosus]
MKCEDLQAYHTLLQQCRQRLVHRGFLRSFIKQILVGQCDLQTDLSDHRHHIDEHFGQVKGVAQFTGGVVPGEDVILVVPAFTTRYHCHIRILPSFYVLVERLVAIFVCSTVYKPCAVHAYAIPCHGRDKKRIPCSLAPTPDGYHGRQIEGEDDNQKFIKSVEANFTY